MDKPAIPVIGFRIALLVTIAVILYLATSEQSYPVVENLNDKFSHILAFGTLAFFLDFSLPDSRFDWMKIVELLAFGVLIEVVQSFIPYRDASLLDVVADGAGIAAYALVAVPVLRRTPWLQRRWASTTTPPA